MNTSSGTNDISTVAEALGEGELPSSFCNEFRRTGGELTQLAGGDVSVVGACAVHTGIQFILRNFSPGQVATWLEEQAQDLRRFAEQAGET